MTLNAQTILLFYRPNPGFMRQLELFEKMGSKFDTNNELWRKYRLNIMADRMQAGKEMFNFFPVIDIC